jgi:hypothetical protein
VDIWFEDYFSGIYIARYGIYLNRCQRHKATTNEHILSPQSSIDGCGTILPQIGAKKRLNNEKKIVSK